MGAVTSRFAQLTDDIPWDNINININIDDISLRRTLIYTGLGLLTVHQLYHLTYLWRKGIQGPVPLPFLGNMLEFGNGVVPVYDKLAKKYGKVRGMYFGTQPVLILSDADLARQILIKEFSSFQSRSLKSVSVPFLEDTLVEASGEVWKRGRSYISPTFSGSKMKQMVPAMNEKCDILIEILDSKEGNSFDCKEVYGSYVLDVIAVCAYGFESDCQRNKEDAFLVNTLKLFDFRMYTFICRMVFPFLIPLFNKFRFFDLVPMKAMDFFADLVRQSIELRTDSGETGRKDFLQLMIDAAEAVGDDSVTDGDAPKKRKKIPLTQAELIGQSMLFFFAGYDTVSVTMSFASYALAKYPEIQKRLQEEIDDLTAEGEPVSYDAVFKMEYLEKVWCESQRLWPVGFLLERICNQEFTHNGLTIPNGQYMNIDVWSIHHNPEYWDDPLTFNPENFSKEAKESRHPCAFMPFGMGPRQCVAMRFAILEGKMGLVRMLQKFSFELDSEKTPDLDDVSSFGNTSSLYPPKGIHLRVVPRE